MIPDALPSLRTLALTLGLWTLMILSVVLLVEIFPFPDSPLFLGASLAIVYWIVKTYIATGEG